MKIIRGVLLHQSLLRNNWSALALTVFLLLSGCATFSPDRGMGVVADVAGDTIKKDVIAIRSVDDAQQADDSVKRLPHRTLTVAADSGASRSPVPINPRPAFRDDVARGGGVSESPAGRV